MKKGTVKRIIFILSLLAFGLIVQRYGFSRLGRELWTSGFIIVPVVGIWLAVYLLNTIAFLPIARIYKKELSFWKMMVITISGYSLNNITPFISLGGELFRINNLKDEMGYSNSVTVVIKYFMMHLLSHLLLWVLGLIILVFNLEGSTDKSNIVLSVVLFISFLFLLFYLIISKSIILKLYKLSVKMPLPGSFNTWIMTRRDRIKAINDEIKNFYYKHTKVFYFSLSMEFIARMVASLEIQLVVLSAGYNMNFQQAIYFCSITSLFLNLLFFIPMQIGAKESIYYMMTGSIGINSSIGVYVAIVTRIREIIWVLFGILMLLLIRDKEKMPGKLQEETWKT